MDIVIDYRCDAPIYEQLYDQIVSQIARGQLQPGSCLPSIRNIAKQLGISVITVKKAYELAESKGYLYTVAGKGCFVGGQPGEKGEDRRLILARERLRRELPYYRSLGIGEDEFHALIKEAYAETEDI